MLNDLEERNINIVYETQYECSKHSNKIRFFVRTNMIAGRELAIPPNTIDVWLVNLDRLTYTEGLYWSLLDEQEQTQAAKFRFPELRQKYIHTHGVLRQILAGYLPGTMPETIHLAKAEFGKPYLTDFPELSFNLSHTGAWMLIGATTRAALGVDIEQVKSRTALQGLVKKCFAAKEQEFWQQLSEHQQIEVFFEFWTRKEAFVKAVGRGIALGLEQCEIDTACLSRFAAIPAGCGRVDDWQIICLDVEAGCKAALVVESNNFCVRQRMACFGD